MQPQKYTADIEGKSFEISLNNWAQHASGSVTVRLGDTVVLVTAVMNPHPREGGDFFPLSVEYEEKYYATGKILGSRFIKRETRPSEEAILAARLIDRTIRPRFDLRMRNEIQIVITVLSLDDRHDPDILGLLGASLALSLSDIPWQGPVAGVRVAQKDGAFIINPTTEERLTSASDIIVCGMRDRINMLEAGAQEITEEDFAAAAERGLGAIKELIAFQEMIIAEHAKPKKTVRLLATPPELDKLLRDEFADQIEQGIYHKDKQTAHETKMAIKEKWMAAAGERHPELFQKASAEFMFEEIINEIIHRRILDKGERPDGRGPDDLRVLSAQVAVLPRLHGTGYFCRGETHVLSAVTLGSPGDEQIVEGMEIRGKKHFLHHYNFPPFSVGEVKPMRGPGRREIGHGALAGRALTPLLPPRETFPYTIRVVSEVLSSNGSSSMASVCGSSMALMDAGVPMKCPVAGAAMGIISDASGKYRVLTDIQGPEDHHGDMDFKVAGTREGITAVQMDVKIEGITPEMLRAALDKARSARMKILDAMETAIKEPRPKLSPYAPRIEIIKINPEKIGALIGPGGKVINDIIARTGAQIDIEDDGTVFITSANAESMAQALELVRQVTYELKPGDIIEGKVTRLLEFGAFVEVGPRQDGLIHISELAPWRVERVTDILNIGDTTKAMVKNVDEQGRINLSLKDVPGRYSDEEIARGRAQQGDMPRPHMRPHGGSRFGRPRGR